MKIFNCCFKTKEEPQVKPIVLSTIEINAINQMIASNNNSPTFSMGKFYNYETGASSPDALTMILSQKITPASNLFRPISTSPTQSPTNVLPGQLNNIAEEN